MCEPHARVLRLRRLSTEAAAWVSGDGLDGGGSGALDVGLGHFGHPFGGLGRAFAGGGVGDGAWSGDGSFRTGRRVLAKSSTAAFRFFTS